METNKKLIISLASISIVAVAAIISLVVVLAAFAVTSTNSFTIKYTAEGVSADVTAEYRLASTTDGSGTYTNILTADNKTTIQFDRQATGTSTSQSFNALSVDTITKNQFLVIKYTIKNTGTSTFNVSMALTNSTTSNFNLGYITTTNSVDPTVAALENITTTASFTGAEIAANQTVYFYMVFSIKDIQIDGTISGTSTWTLALP